MSLFTATDLLRFIKAAEENFADDYPCIVDRYSFAVFAGTSQYTLPDYITNIRRITWQGFKLDPLPQRDLRQSFQSGSQSGRPFWYVFNNIGALKIQLYPTPSTAIAQYTTNLWGSNIINAVIVEYFRTPDQITYVIPAFLRRRLLKQYVNQYAYSIEGKGLDLKASEYFKQRFNDLKELYGAALADLTNKPRNLVASPYSRNQGNFPPAPVLPIDRYGWSVDE